MTERLISADSHLKITHDQVKGYLDPQYHGAYDEASGAYEARMSRGTGAANRAGAQVASSNSVFGRTAYWDPTARLEDMDTDGVDVEVIYSEVSAFRYLSNVGDGVGPAVQAFNDALHDFAQVDPKRLIVSYQIPIHDIDLAIAEVERASSTLGRSRCNSRCSPPSWEKRTTTTTGTYRCSR